MDDFYFEDDTSNVEIQILDAKNAYKKLDPHVKSQMRTLDPKEPAVFSVPLSVYPFQPWAKHPNPVAWFNQGLTAQTWPAYADYQNKLRHVVLKETVSNLPNAQHGSVQLSTPSANRQ